MSNDATTTVSSTEHRNWVMIAMVFSSLLVATGFSLQHEFFHDDANGRIHRFHHTGVDWIVLDLPYCLSAIEFKTRRGQALVRGFLLIFLPQALGRLDGCVNGVERQVSKKFPVLVRLNK